MMKRTFKIYTILVNVILTLTLIPTALVAQSTFDLDNKNGFKDFKLGDPFSKYSNQLEYLGILDGTDNVKGYRYIGYCCKTVFEFNVEDINLEFKNNKLTKILITLEKFQKEYEISGQFTKYDQSNYNKLNSSFTTLFGKPTGYDADDKTGAFYTGWEGEKVVLVTKFLFICSKCGDQAWISIEDKKAQTEILNSGF